MSQYNFKLKAAIKNSGRLQWWVAYQSGLSEFEMSRIINGHCRPSKRDKISLARVLQVKQSQIF